MKAVYDLGIRLRWPTLVLEHIEWYIDRRNMTKILSLRPLFSLINLHPAAGIFTIELFQVRAYPWSNCVFSPIWTIIKFYFITFMPQCFQMLSSVTLIKFHISILKLLEIIHQRLYVIIVHAFWHHNGQILIKWITFTMK